MSSPTTAVPLIDMEQVNGPHRQALLAAAERVIASGDFGVGHEVESFEAELSEALGVGEVIGVHSGTSALQLALMAAGIGPGDEVILPPNTFFATAEAVVGAGATPVLADVDPSTALLDPAAVEAAVTPRTAAVIPVHLYGQPVDADQFRALSQRHGLFLLEDAAQAIGASWNGRPVGRLGDAAALSFYPTKNLGALGQGGAVVTDRADVARAVRLLRSHGEEPRYIHQRIGFNERMDGLQAAFLRVKLAHMAEAQRLRDEAVAAYADALDHLSGVHQLDVRPGARHVHHLLVVRVAHRDTVLDGLRQRGIGAAVHYPVPIHLQPACAGIAPAGALPHAETLAESILTLPLYPGITTVQIQRCVAALEDVLKEEAA